jgi:hypothetical protein
MHGRNFLLAVTLVAAAATVPAWGQASSGQGAPSNPDFSGIWARVSFPGFGRPLAGAGPVINKKRTPNGVPSFAGGGPLINKNRSPNEGWRPAHSSVQGRPQLASAVILSS